MRHDGETKRRIGAAVSKAHLASGAMKALWSDPAYREKMARRRIKGNAPAANEKRRREMDGFLLAPETVRIADGMRQAGASRNAIAKRLGVCPRTLASRWPRMFPNPLDSAG